jgi:hypothetical protein
MANEWNYREDDGYREALQAAILEALANSPGMNGLLLEDLVEALVLDDGMATEDLGQHTKEALLDMEERGSVVRYPDSCWCIV